MGFTSLSTALIISLRGRNIEPERNLLLFTNSSKGSISCIRTNANSKPLPIPVDRINLYEKYITAVKHLTNGTLRNLPAAKGKATTPTPNAAETIPYIWSRRSLPTISPTTAAN